MCSIHLFGFIVILLNNTVFSVPLKEIRAALNNDDMVRTNNDCNCVCGMNNRQMRVVGGNVTKVHEFPWLVGLSKDGEFYCGAALITNKHLLTAAHCVSGFDERKITAALGDHDRSDKNRFSIIQVKRIKSAHPHNLFDPSSYNNDIAILELEDSVEFDNTIQPACLPNSELVDYTGQMAVVAGWGRIKEKSENPNVPQKVAVPVWSKKDCYNSDYGEYKLSENMFCAGYEKGGKDACQGDSGGPLQVKTPQGNMEVIGVVSWGRGCGRPKLPGIYTKVANYLHWIREILNGECLCSPPSHTSRRA